MGGWGHALFFLQFLKMYSFVGVGLYDIRNGLLGIS